MKRYLYPQILKDLKKKAVFVTGPRQIGKTFLAKQILQEYQHPQYLNYDAIDDRRIIRDQSWPLKTDLLVFDEIHKMKNWKNYIKGVYDTKSENQHVLITGSARLDTYRQTGESLAGRYYHLRLMPVSVKEAAQFGHPYDIIERINRLGGFPEPFLSDAEEETARWRNQYYTDLIREDILEFSRIHEINEMKTLLELLRYRTGSPVSYRSLAEDLHIAPNTVKKYIRILESLYIIFLISPYHRNIARSIQKEAKLYFFDTGLVQEDEDQRFENTCAVCLLKHTFYLQDVKGRDVQLQYIRIKEGKEIDFVLIENQTPAQLIEVKLSDNRVSKTLIGFSKKLPQAQPVQLVHNLRKEENIQGIDILKAGEWLAGLKA